jgi:hypothetical protein
MSIERQKARASTTRFSCVIALPAIVGLLCLAGCGESPVTAPCETWRVQFLHGHKIGYSVTKVQEVREDGQAAVRTDNVDHLTVLRNGQSVTQELRQSSIDTPNGQLLRAECDFGVGLKIACRVRGNQLEIETLGAGATKPTVTSIPWSADYGGPLFIAQSLLHKPMQPGEHRTLKCWMPGFERPATAELNAKKVESVRLLHETRNLLRIDVVGTLPNGVKADSTEWMDKSGEVVRSQQKAMGGALETYLVSKDEALKNAETASLDLLSTMAVKLTRPLEHPRDTKEVKYRIHLNEADPAKVFVVGPSQVVKTIDDHTAEVTVYAIRPGGKDGNRNAPADPPKKEDREPNSFIQSDDSLIIADAEKAAGKETDPWKVAVALETFVYRDVNKKDFSQAFASAAEVARTHEGDCTEHGVFLAALARARGIPARVAIGLVYLKGTQSFFYHLWTEAYIGDRWIPLDATIARGGIGADHLKIATTNLAGASAYSAFLPVAEVVGQMKIEVVEQK